MSAKNNVSTGRGAGRVALKWGIGMVALAVAGSLQAKTLVYCSEGSPEGFVLAPLSPDRDCILS